jgi:23S rRNA A2030 N6-methylase RlmJ
MQRMKEKKESAEKIKAYLSEIHPLEPKEDNIFRDITIKENARQRDKHLTDLIHPDLLKLSNVTFDKFKKSQFKRGLNSKEAPFPISPRLAPYIVKDPIFEVKNYYWCSCGMSRNQPF